MSKQRAGGIVVVIALVWGAILAGSLRQPGYTDAYYYFNAGQRWAQGDGLTDQVLWVYINAPETLPGPSHTYWMPLESLLAGASMALFGAHFGAAQLPSVLSFAGLVALAFWLGGYVGQNRRTAWIAAWLMLFSGFFTPFWTTTDTFAVYGLVGAGALIAAGRGRITGDWRWFALGGALSGLGHLARADGVLLALVLGVVAWWPGAAFSIRKRMNLSLVAVVAYGAVMVPWFVRNIDVLGAPLPSGGLQTVWLRGYNELVNYPPGVSAADFWEWGLNNILQSRWEALLSNLGTFIAVETWVILGPFVIAALWSRRRDPFWLGVSLYAIGLHLAMTFVFAYPGYRGGLFHSSSALMPFWAVVGVMGLDASLEWLGRRRRWRIQQAKTVFGGALMVLALVISVGVWLARVAKMNDNGAFYRTLADELPEGAVVMVNDPPALYYHTGLAGVVVPNAEPTVVPEIAALYGVTHLVLDANRTEPFTGLFLDDEAYPFLRLVSHTGQETPDPKDDHKVFEILLPEQTP